jgi:hypothetical protein
MANPMKSKLTKAIHMERLLLGNGRIIAPFILSAKLKARVRLMRSPEERPEDMHVPYADAASALGLGDFPLSIDAEPAHANAVRRISAVLADSESQHRAALAAMQEQMLEWMAPGAPTIRVDAHLMIERLVVDWATAFLGIGGVESPDPWTAARAVIQRTYLSPAFPGLATRPDHAEIEHAAKSWTHDVSALAESDIPEGSVAHHLRRWHQADGDDAAQRTSVDLLGLLGGPTELTITAAQKVLDAALDDRHLWSIAHLAATASGDPKRFTATVAKLIDHRPPQYFVPRLKGRARVMVPLWAPAPLVSRGQGTAFGVGRHLCLGHGQALDVIAALLYPVFLYPHAVRVPRGRVIELSTSSRSRLQTMVGLVSAPRVVRVAGHKLGLRRE